MKLFRSLLVLTLFFVLVGCDKTIEESSLVQRNGLYYQINTTEPFTGSVISYHDNGQIKLSFNIEKGLKEGLFEEFYDNGQLFSSVNYFMDGKEGTEHVYYTNGTIQYVNRYKNNLLHGVKETYYEEIGVLMTKEHYDKGLLKDISYYSAIDPGVEFLTCITSFDEDADRFLENDSTVSLRIKGKYFTNGKIIWPDSLEEEIYYKKSTGKTFTGIVYTKFRDYSYDREDYFETLDERFYVKDGIPHGPYESFLNGDPRQQGNLVWGRKSGLWKYFNEDGTLEKKKCWEKDKAVDMSFCKGQE